MHETLLGIPHFYLHTHVLLLAHVCASDSTHMCCPSHSRVLPLALVCVRGSTHVCYYSHTCVHRLRV